MTNNHPIPLPSEDMVQQWRDTWADKKFCCEMDDYIAVRAALWGADRELAACCEWLYEGGKTSTSDKLRDARRPKPSLKEQALEVFEALIHGDSSGLDVGVIRRALEALPND